MYALFEAFQALDSSTDTFAYLRESLEERISSVDSVVEGPGHGSGSPGNGSTGAEGGVRNFLKQEATRQEVQWREIIQRAQDLRRNVKTAASIQRAKVGQWLADNEKYEAAIRDVGAKQARLWGRGRVQRG